VLLFGGGGDYRNQRLLFRSFILPKVNFRSISYRYTELRAGFAAQNAGVRISPLPNENTLQPQRVFIWRRRGDSNSRSRFLRTNDLANRPLQPLGYSSVFQRLVAHIMCHHVGGIWMKILVGWRVPFNPFYACGMKRFHCLADESALALREAKMNWVRSSSSRQLR
jgi:hypothetical protein